MVENVSSTNNFHRLSIELDANQVSPQVKALACGKYEFCNDYRGCYVTNAARAYCNMYSEGERDIMCLIEMKRFDTFGGYIIIEAEYAHLLHTINLGAVSHVVYIAKGMTKFEPPLIKKQVHSKNKVSCYVLSHWAELLGLSFIGKTDGLAILGNEAYNEAKEIMQFATTIFVNKNEIGAIASVSIRNFDNEQAINNAMGLAQNKRPIRWLVETTSGDIVYKLSGLESFMIVEGKIPFHITFAWMAGKMENLLQFGALVSYAFQQCYWRQYGTVIFNSKQAAVGYGHVCDWASTIIVEESLHDVLNHLFNVLVKFSPAGCKVIKRSGMAPSKVKTIDEFQHMIRRDVWYAKALDEGMYDKDSTFHYMYKALWSMPHNLDLFAFSIGEGQHVRPTHHPGEVFAYLLYFYVFQDKHSRAALRKDINTKMIRGEYENFHKESHSFSTNKFYSDVTVNNVYPVDIVARLMAAKIEYVAATKSGTVDIDGVDIKANTYYLVGDLRDYTDAVRVKKTTFNHLPWKLRIVTYKIGNKNRSFVLGHD